MRQEQRQAEAKAERAKELGGGPQADKERTSSSKTQTSANNPLRALLMTLLVKREAQPTTMTVKAIPRRLHVVYVRKDLSMRLARSAIRDRDSPRHGCNHHHSRTALTSGLPWCLAIPHEDPTPKTNMPPFKRSHPVRTAHIHTFLDTNCQRFCPFFGFFSTLLLSSHFSFLHLPP